LLVSSEIYRKITINLRNQIKEIKALLILVNRESHIHLQSVAMVK